jgi:hypothetical protein
MNTEDEGSIIAKIINTENAKKNKIICVENDKSKVKEYLTDIKITNPNEYIQQIPNKKKERDILYITGASGSGKSYYTRDYVKQYHATYPKNPVYLLSSLNEDETLDKLNYIKRINLDQKFFDSNLSIEDFRDTLVIADDVDCLTDKLMKRKITEILDIILQTGRHSRTSLIYTSHIANRGNDTKMILNECHSITIFPNTAGNRTVKYLLENLFGLDKDEIKKIRKIGTTTSRYITLMKTFPITVIHQKGAYILRKED